MAWQRFGLSQLGSMVKSCFAPIAAAWVGHVGNEINQHIHEKEVNLGTAQISAIANILAIVGTGIEFFSDFFKVIYASDKRMLAVVASQGMLGITSGVFALLDFANPEHLIESSRLAAVSSTAFLAGSAYAKYMLAKEHEPVRASTTGMLKEAFKEALPIAGSILVALESKEMMHVLPNADFITQQSNVLNFFVVSGAFFEFIKEIALRADSLNLDAAALVLCMMGGSGTGLEGLIYSDESYVKGILCSVGASFFAAGRLLALRSDVNAEVEVEERPSFMLQQV